MPDTNKSGSWNLKSRFIILQLQISGVQSFAKDQKKMKSFYLTNDIKKCLYDMAIIYFELNVIQFYLSVSYFNSIIVLLKLINNNVLESIRWRFQKNLIYLVNYFFFNHLLSFVLLFISTNISPKNVQWYFKWNRFILKNGVWFFLDNYSFFQICKNCLI